MTVASSTSASGGLIVGPCQGQATFLANGRTYVTSQLSPTKVITIPQASHVDWEGGELGHTPASPNGPTRIMHGEVQLVLPVGTVHVYRWNNGYHLGYGVLSPSHHYANQGTEHYRLPSVLDNVKLRLTGFQIDNGVETCHGMATIEVKAPTFANPVAIGSIAGLVIFGGVLFFAGRPVYRRFRAEFWSQDPW